MHGEITIHLLLACQTFVQQCHHPCLTSHDIYPAHGPAQFCRPDRHQQQQQCLCGSVLACYLHSMLPTPVHMLLGAVHAPDQRLGPETGCCHAGTAAALNRWAEGAQDHCVHQHCRDVADHRRHRVRDRPRLCQAEGVQPPHPSGVPASLPHIQSERVHPSASTCWLLLLPKCAAFALAKKDYLHLGSLKVCSSV